MPIVYKGLFEILRKRNISKTEFRTRVNISTATLAKLSKDEPVSLFVIENICKELNCHPGDILNYQKEKLNNRILEILLEEKERKLKGGLYHTTQINFAYNTNHMEGNKLSKEQTHHIYETHSVIAENKEAIRIDDIIETWNHFTCFDFILEHVQDKLSEELIKELHRILKTNTGDEKIEWFNVGEYKSRPNFIGDRKTLEPSKVHSEITALLQQYHDKKDITIKDIIDFHYRFETIHPFQDGNGRVGRLLLFKECLKHNIIPFIIEDIYKAYYYQGLKKYLEDKTYLIDTCLLQQDKYRELLQYYIENIEDKEK